MRLQFGNYERQFAQGIRKYGNSALNYINLTALLMVRRRLFLKEKMPPVS